MRLHVIEEIRARLHLQDTIRTRAHDFEARVAQLFGEDAEDESELQLPLDLSPQRRVRDAGYHH